MRRLTRRTWKAKQKKLARAVLAGTTPCATCRKEYPPGSPSLVGTRCRDRRSCLQRALSGRGLPKFVTLGSVRGGEYVRPGKFVAPGTQKERQAAEYQHFFDEKRRVDLIVL